jgi:hypothetical protein
VPAGRGDRVRLPDVPDLAEAVPLQPGGQVTGGEAGQPRLAAFGGGRADQLGVAAAGLVPQAGDSR